MAHFQCETIIPASCSEVFEYLCDPRRVPELLAPEIDVELIGGEELPLRKGNEFTYNMTRFGLSQQISFRVEDVLRGSRLTYKQVEGVFKYWLHTQKFFEHSRAQTLVTDIVEYELPFGLFGHLANDLFFRADLRRLLERRLHKAKEFFVARANATEPSV